MPVQLLLDLLGELFLPGAVGLGLRGGAAVVMTSVGIGVVDALLFHKTLRR